MPNRTVKLTSLDWDFIYEVLSNTDFKDKGTNYHIHGEINENNQECAIFDKEIELVLEDKSMFKIGIVDRTRVYPPSDEEPNGTIKLEKIINFQRMVN